jgi:hypothetical protein
VANPPVGAQAAAAAAARAQQQRAAAAAPAAAAAAQRRPAAAAAAPAAQRQQRAAAPPAATGSGFRIGGLELSAEFEAWARQQMLHFNGNEELGMVEYLWWVVLFLGGGGAGDGGRGRGGVGFVWWPTSMGAKVGCASHQLCVQCA